jgi:uncharacterized protein (TIGR02145 family)
MKTLYLVLISLLIVGGTTSCKKKGCTDPNASNYDPKAEVDDGSCTYPQPTCDPVTDARDGQTYAAVKIGDQCWIAENMNYDTNDSSWCYGDNTANCDIYGRLYSQSAAVEACPDGWHLPADAEWDELVDFLGGSSAAGGKLKVGGSSGFEAPYGGGRHPSFGYSGEGTDATFWTTTFFGGARYYTYSMSVIYPDSILRGPFDKSNGYSCRCVKD